MIILLSGISGSGKSTLAKKFVQKHKEFVHIELDDFYKENKPIVTLSNDDKVKNWDCEEAIDWSLFNKEVCQNEGNIIISGFCLKDELLQFGCDKHVHLSTDSKKEDYTILQRCTLARMISKKLTMNKIKRDALIVKELVMPFYKDSLKKSSITHTIEVYENYNRKDVENLLEELEIITNQ